MQFKATTNLDSRQPVVLELVYIKIVPVAVDFRINIPSNLNGREVGHKDENILGVHIAKWHQGFLGRSLGHDQFDLAEHSNSI